MMMRIQTGFRGVDAAASPASPVSPGGGGVPLTAMLGQGPASGGNDHEQEGEGLVVDGDEEAVIVEAEQEEEEEEDEDEEDYGVVVSRPQNRMLRDHEEERWVGESYGQQHQPQQQHQQQFAPAPPTPTMSPRPGMSIASPKFPIPSPQAMKVETALMALAPSLPSVSSPHSQPPYGQQYYHPNEESSSDGIQQQQQQTQGRGLSLTTRLRSMSSLGNLHVSPSSPASSSAVVSAGSPPLSALSSSSPFGLPSSPAVSPSTPTVPGNGKENVSGRESGIKGSGSGGALSTLLLGIQKKAPKRKLVVSGVAMGDVDAYEAVKRWCEVGGFSLG
jgi:hypothetical protein